MNQLANMEVSPQVRLTLLFGLGVSPLFFNGILNSIIAPIPALYWLFEVLIWIVLPLLAIRLMLKIDNISLADFGLHKNIFHKESLVGVVVISILFAPVCLATYKYSSIYSESLVIDVSLFDYQSMIPDQGMMRYLVIIYFSLTAGFVEEIFFRGVLFKITRSIKYGLYVFLISSPVLFSLIHWENGLTNMLATFLFGLIMAIAYLIFRNIWPLTIGHTVTNLVWFSHTSSV